MSESETALPKNIENFFPRKYDWLDPVTKAFVTINEILSNYVIGAGGTQIQFRGYTPEEFAGGQSGRKEFEIGLTADDLPHVEPVKTLIIEHLTSEPAENWEVATADFQISEKYILLVIKHRTIKNKTIRQEIAGADFDLLVSEKPEIVGIIENDSWEFGMMKSAILRGFK